MAYGNFAPTAFTLTVYGEITVLTFNEPKTLKNTVAIDCKRNCFRPAFQLCEIMFFQLTKEHAGSSNPDNQTTTNSVNCSPLQHSRRM